MVSTVACLLKDVLHIVGWPGTQFGDSNTPSKLIILSQTFNEESIFQKGMVPAFRFVRSAVRDPFRQNEY